MPYMERMRFDQCFQESIFMFCSSILFIFLKKRKADVVKRKGPLLYIEKSTCL